MELNDREAYTQGDITISTHFQTTEYVRKRRVTANDGRVDIFNPPPKTKTLTVGEKTPYCILGRPLQQRMGGEKLSLFTLIQYKTKKQIPDVRTFTY